MEDFVLDVVQQLVTRWREDREKPWTEMRHGRCQGYETALALLLNQDTTWVRRALKEELL